MLLGAKPKRSKALHRSQLLCNHDLAMLFYILPLPSSSYSLLAQDYKQSLTYFLWAKQSNIIQYPQDLGFQLSSCLCTHCHPLLFKYCIKTCTVDYQLEEILKEDGRAITIRPLFCPALCSLLATLSKCVCRTSWSPQAARSFVCSAKAQSSQELHPDRLTWSSTETGVPGHGPKLMVLDCCIGRSLHIFFKGRGLGKTQTCLHQGPAPHPQHHSFFCFSHHISTILSKNLYHLCIYSYSV